MLLVIVTVLCFLELHFQLVAGQYSLIVSPNPVVAGSSVTFTCTTSPVQTAVLWTEITTTNANAYTYYLNNGQCERSNGNPPADYTFTCNTTGVFTVRLTADYSGHRGSIWKCGDAFGNTEESSITLLVHAPLTIVTILNTTIIPLTVNQGSSVTLMCETNPTDPVSSITWRRDSQTVSQGVSSSTRSTTQGRVTISAWSKSIQWEDRGGYGCLASWNSAAVNRSSQILSLVVQVPVSAVTLTNITTTNQEITVTEDSTLALSCQTSPAYPAPTVTWYIKGSQTSSGVVSETDTQTNGQIITISTIIRTVRRNNDRDTYYCGAGALQSLTVSVNVYYGPDKGHVILYKSSVVREMSNVTLTCRTQTTVNPDVDFSWSYGDNTQITSGIGSKQGSARNTWSQTLTVTPLTDCNKQVIRCRITNTATRVSETVQTSMDLDVICPPVSFKALASTANSVILTWVPRYTRSGYRQEFHVQYRKQSSGDNWMVKIFPDIKENIMSGAVDGLTPDTVYAFRIKSVNGSNESPFSPEISKATLAKEFQPTSSPVPSNLGLGAGIGIGVGISGIVAAGGFAVFYILGRRKASARPSKDRNKQQISGSERRTSDGSTREAASPPSDYTQLGHNTAPNMYEQIEGHHYQNTERGVEHNQYESLDVGSPQNLESRPTQLYVNEAKRSGGYYSFHVREKCKILKRRKRVWKVVKQPCKKQSFYICEKK